MKSILTKILSFIIIATVILVPAAQITVRAEGTAAEEQAFSSAIAALMKEYPQNYYWNEYNGKDSQGIAKAGTIACKGKSNYDGKSCVSHGYCAYAGISCTCACGYYHGWQCFGFANLLAYKALGSWATNNYYASGVNTAAGWKYYKSVSEYFAGDVVRINGSHSIFIYKVDSKNVYYAECNADGACKIDWQNSMSISSLKSKTTFVVHKSGNKLKGTLSSSDTTLSDDRIATDFYANIKDGVYTLKSVSSGKYMGVKGSTNKDGTNVLTYDYKNSNAFKFHIKHVGDGKYLLYSLVSKSGSDYERVLDVWTGVYGGTPEAGDKIDIYERVSTEDKCQLFYLVPQSNGSYVLELVSVPGLVVASKTKETAATEGGAMTARVYKGYTTQQWYICDESGERVDASIDAQISENASYGLGVFKVTPSIGLNIRSGPGTKYSKIGAIPQNTNITISDVNGSWGYTSYNGISGWVCMDYLVRSSGSSGTNAEKYKVTPSVGLNIRENAGTTYAKVGFIPHGKTIYITTIQNNWGYTTYGEVTGWVCMDYLSKVTSESGGNTGDSSGTPGSDTSPDVIDDDTSLAIVRDKLSGINGSQFVITGPQVEFGGNMINSFSFTGRINLNIGNLKIVSDEDDPTKVKVLIGFDESASANISGAENDQSYWKKAYKEVKQLYTDATGKKVSDTRLWNRFSALRGKLKSSNMNMLINTSAMMAGYLEFQIQNGDLALIEGGILASFSGRVDLNYPIIPPSVVVGIGIEAGLKSELKLMLGENGSIIPSAILYPHLTLDAHAGFKASLFGVNFASAYARLYARVDGEIDLLKFYRDTDPVKLYLSGGLLLEANILGMKKEKDFPFGEAIQIYPYTSTSMMMSTAGEFIYGEENSLDLFEAIDREYLNAPTIYAIGNDADDFEKNNVYPYNSVQLVKFDNDNLLLLWIEDTGLKNVNNIGTLAYSFYDGTQWSEYKYIFESGTGNDSPVVYSDGTKAYVVWRQSTEELDESTELAVAITKYELFVSVFDSSSMTFSDPIKITDNEIFEYNYDIIGEDGAFTVLWVESESNGLSDTTTVNTVHSVKYDSNGSISSPATILLSTEQVINQVYTNGETLYYTLSSGEENALFHTLDNETVLISDNITSFYIENGIVFYVEDDILKSYDGYTIASYSISNVSNFKIVSDGDTYHVFSMQTNELLGTDLYYSTLDIQTHLSTPFVVFSQNEEVYIKNYIPVVLGDGTIKIASNNSLSSDGYTVSAIKVSDECNNIDIKADYVDFDDAELKNEVINLNIHVTNNSPVALKSFIVEIFSSDNCLMYSKTVDVTFDAFDSGVITVAYTLNKDYTDEVLSIRVSPVNVEDYLPDNNCVQTSLECIHLSSDETIIIKHPTLDEEGAYGFICANCNREVISGVIPTLTFIPGDVNNDGKVSNTDILRIFRYIYNSSLYPIDIIESADINHDGNITNIDILKIFRYIYNPALYPLE